MKFLVLTRAITNGGDYLIVKKVKEVLEYHTNRSEFCYKSGFDSFEGKIQYINSFDAILICGGPGYENRLLNTQSFPIFKLLNQINIPIHFIGVGWYGKTGNQEEIYQYKFSDKAKNILDAVTERGGYLGCRDYLSQRVLKRNGYTNSIMTGCPVWYDFDFLNETKVRRKSQSEVKRIVISDPGMTKVKEQHMQRADQAINIIQLVQRLFPDAEIVFTFNNGIETVYSTSCNTRIFEFLCKQNIRVEELTKDAEKFAVYNPSDLHIGFRVHSHIYSLSRRIPSILIAEDARGCGINEVLGLEQITNYDIKESSNLNPYLIECLEDAIQELFDSGFIKIENAFRIMKDTYEKQMKEFLYKIGVR